MSGAEVAVPLAAAGLSAGGGIAAAGKGGGSSEMPSFFRRTAGNLSSDIRAASRFPAFGSSRFHFDANGSLVPNAGTFQTTPARNKLLDVMGVDTSRTLPNSANLGLNRKALIEGTNFFANLFGNEDINQSLDFQRRVLSGERLEDLGPLFEQVRERGLAQELEAGRRIGGLRSSGTGSRAADFLTRAEAQESAVLLGAQQAAAQALPDLLFRRGEAAFLPHRVFSQSLGLSGAGNTLIPPAQFPNTKGQGFETAGGFVNQIPTSGKGSRGGGGAADFPEVGPPYVPGG